MATVPGRSPCPLDYDHPEVAGRRFVVFFDDQRRWLHITPDLYELLGYSSSELIGRTVDTMLPDGIERNDQLWRDFLRTGRLRTVLLLRTKPGEIVGMSAESRKLGDGCMVCVLTPIALI